MNTKTIIVTLLIVIAIKYTYDNSNKNKFDFVDSPVEKKTKVEKVDSKKEKSEQKNKVTAFEEEVKTVYIRGLGEYSNSSLIEIKKSIEEFYNYECIIESSVGVTDVMYDETGQNLEVSNCIRELGEKNKKIIYVTNYNIVSEGMELRGGTFLKCNTIIIESGKHNKKTVLHEIGHTLGLIHCENKNCLMSIYNDEYVVTDFCEICKKKLRYEDI